MKSKSHTLSFANLMKKCPGVIELESTYHKTVDDLVYQCRHELDLLEEGQDSNRIENKRQEKAVRKFMALCIENGGTEI